MRSLYISGGKVVSLSAGKNLWLLKMAFDKHRTGVENHIRKHWQDRELEQDSYRLPLLRLLYPGRSDEDLEQNMWPRLESVFDTNRK